MNSNKAILANPIHLLAFGFGAGLSPKAPGTVGTAVAVLIYLALPSMSPIIYAGLVLLSFIFGIWLCGKTAEDLGVHDHGGIVWDEFVGMWIALGLFPDNIYGVLMAFTLFRLFDVLKPWPISWLDEYLPGGLGIMVDDVVAGFMALLCLLAIDRWLMPIIV